MQRTADRSRFAVTPRLLLTALLAVSFAGCTSDDIRSGDLPSSTADGLPTDGPVQFPGADDYVENSGLEAKAGDTVVFGATPVENNGDADATLTSAALTEVSGDRNASLRTVRVVDLTHGGDMVGAAQWPFEDYRQRSVPLKDYVLAPGDQAELLFIVDVTTSGMTEWRTSELRYTANGRPYAAVADFGFQVCPTDSC